MSERGSFVTEYIYCADCLRAAQKVLLAREKYLCSEQLVSWEPGGALLPIIAGKIGGLASGEELRAMEELGALLELRLCHPLRIAVIPDSEREGRIFFFHPKGARNGDQAR